jgi:hypothetical protein
MSASLSKLEIDRITFVLGIVKQAHEICEEIYNVQEQTTENVVSDSAEGAVQEAIEQLGEAFDSIDDAVDKLEETLRLNELAEERFAARGPSNDDDAA